MWIGKKVRMVNCSESEKYKDKIWTVRSEPWNLCGTKVVLLEGKSGSFDLSCLEVVNDE